MPVQPLALTGPQGVRVEGRRLYEKQKMLETEYREAVAHNQVVVFVKGDDRRKTISFSLDEA